MEIVRIFLKSWEDGKLLGFTVTVYDCKFPRFRSGVTILHTLELICQLWGSLNLERSNHFCLFTFCWNFSTATLLLRLSKAVWLLCRLVCISLWSWVGKKKKKKQKRRKHSLKSVHLSAPGHEIFCCISFPCTYFKWQWVSQTQIPKKNILDTK